jgi:hypothetical protein
MGSTCSRPKAHGGQKSVSTVEDAEAAEEALVEQHAAAIERLQAQHEVELRPLHAEVSRLQSAYQSQLAKATNARVVATTQREARSARNKVLDPIKNEQEDARERIDQRLAEQRQEVMDMRRQHDMELRTLQKSLGDQLEVYADAATARGYTTARSTGLFSGAEPAPTTRRTVQATTRSEERPQPLPPPPGHDPPSPSKGEPATTRRASKTKGAATDRKSAATERRVSAGTKHSFEQ